MKIEAIMIMTPKLRKDLYAAFLKQENKCFEVNN